MFVLIALVGCGADPLAELGMAPIPVEADDEELVVPGTPPASGEALEMGGAVEQPEAVAVEAPPQPPPPKFEPVSIPQGPREGGGVRWEGVTGRGEGQLVPMGDRGEFGRR